MADDSADLYDFAEDDVPAPKPKPKPRRRVVASADAGASAVGAPTLNYRNAKSPASKRDRLAAARDKQQWEQDVAADVARKEWLVPVIGIGVSAVLFLLMGLTTDGPAGMALFAVVFLVLTVVYTVVAVIAAFIAASIGVGVGGTIWMSILQLCAASTMALTAEWTVEWIVGIGGIFSFAIYVLVLMVSLNVMLDMDGNDAQIFAIIFIALQWIATFGVIMVILSLGFEFGL